MKIENQVASLEQCQKLQQLGISGALLEYCKPINREMYIRFKPFIDTADVKEIQCDAFTVAELNQMLPTYHYAMRKLNNPTLKEEWVCESSETGLRCDADTQAECLAEMLIYLLENKLITHEEVNQRLNP